MAVWGGWVYGGWENGLRLGYDQWYENGHMYVRLYAQTLYAVEDSSNTFTLSGSHSDSKAVAINHGSSGGTTTIGTYSRSVPQVYGSAQTGSWSASLSDVHVFGTATVSGSWSVPALPYLAPRPPLSPAVVLDSSGRPRVTWVGDADSPTNPRPWHGVRVYRKVNGVWGGSYVAQLGASVTTWTDTSAPANSACQYHVKSYNSGGESVPADAGTVRTVPARPGTPNLSVSGTTILASWLDNSPVEDSYEAYIETTTPAGTSGEWTTGITSNGTQTGTVEWSFPKPAGSAVRIKVRARNTAGASPDSAWSNLLMLEVAPYAPTLQQPAQVVAAGEPIPVSWVPNHPDGSQQARYQLRHRVQGTTTWTTRTAVTSAATSTTIPATAGTSGQSVEIQVRTLGAHTEWGAWSESRVTLISARPVGTLATPTLTAPSVTLSWTYSDSDGHPQNAYKITVKRAGAVVHEMTGYGTATTYTTPMILDNGAAYVFELMVQDSTGLWSTVSTRSGTVTYPAPPAPTLSPPVWDVETGSVLLTCSTPTPGSGEQAATSLTVQRRTSGEQWDTILEGLPISGSVTDPIPPLTPHLEYRILAVSALDTTAPSTPATVDTSNTDGWVYLNAGPGWGQQIRVRANARAAVGAGRHKALHQFAGRTGVVEYATSASHASSTLSWSDSMHSREGQATAAQIEEFVRTTSAPVCYRDCSGGLSGGVRRFVALRDLSYSYEGVTMTGTLEMVEASYRG